MVFIADGGAPPAPNNGWYQQFIGWYGQGHLILDPKAKSPTIRTDQPYYQGAIIARYNGIANVAFIDGHAKGLKVNELMKSVYNPNGAPSPWVGSGPGACYYPYFSLSDQTGQQPCNNQLQAW